MTDSPDDKSGECLLNNNPDIKPEQDACPWYINSTKYHNCFWLYVMDNSSIDGSMPELVQSEIAALLGWSNTKTHFMLKQAMVELIDALKKRKANELLSTGPEQPIDITTFDIDPISNYTSEDTEE